MTDADNEFIKALECCINNKCHKCDRFKAGDSRIEHKDKMLSDAFDLINRLKAENDNLFFTLRGVMHFVDKWLEGDELNKGEVNRAIAMRDKTLEITERQAEQIEALIAGQATLQSHIAKKDADISQLEYDIELLRQEKVVVQDETITNFADGLKREFKIEPEYHRDTMWICDIVRETIDKHIKSWREQNGIL